MVGHVLGAATSTNWRSGSLLRRALLVDAIASGIGALPLLIGAEWLSPHFGLSIAFLRTVGIILVPWVVLLLLVAARPRRPSIAIGSVIVMNALWVIASAGMLISDVVSPTPLGVAVVIVQAVLVVVFAGLQFMGWSRN